MAPAPEQAPTSARLTLVSLSEDFLDALLSGERAKAEALGGFRLPPEWPGSAGESFLRLRREDLRKDATLRPWLLRAMVLHAPEPVAVGHCGFHWRPDAEGWLEVGYEVLPDFRHRGLAREAVQALVDWARARHGIQRFRASVSPGNAASVRVVQALGFTEAGVRHDEVDGEERVYERRFD